MRGCGSRPLKAGRRGDDPLGRAFGRNPVRQPVHGEIPLQDNPAAVEFANRLITGQIDIVIFTTGTGFSQLLSQVERVVDRRRFLDALADSTTIVRGPKPAAAMAELGISPTYRVPEPNTWREVLTTIDVHLSIANQRVGLQEYGQTNPSLIAGLEARGAEVIRLRIDDWDFPADTGPLEENVRRLARGELDVVLFTSAHQVVNLLSMANRLGLAGPVRDGLRQAVIASIGPTTSEMLRGSAIPVDMEPTHAKMGHLVNQSAARARGLLECKGRVSAALSPPTTERSSEKSLGLRAVPSPPPGAEAGGAPPWGDSRFLRVPPRAL